MKKLVKHILYTLAMFLMMLILSQFQNTGYDSVIMPFVWGLIFVILIATGIYLYRGYKKGIFTFVLMLVLSVSFVATAQVEHRVPIGNTPDATAPPNADRSIMEQLRGLKNEWGNKFCEYEDSFDPDAAVQNPELFTEDIQQACINANRYIDTYIKALDRGLIEEGIIFDTEWEDTKDCAEDLLEVKGEYEVKLAEKSMGTVLQILESDNNSCWPCGLTSLIIMAVENVVIEMEDNLKSAALDMLGVMFLFWILFKVLMLIGQFGTASNGEFFTEFLTRGIIVIICAAILSFPLAPRSGSGEDNTGFYSYTLSPLISFTAGLSKAFVTIDTSSSNPRVDLNASLPVQPNGQSLAKKLVGGRANALLACSCCQTGSRSDCNGGSIQNGAILDADSKQELLCMTCSVYKQTAPLIAVGRIMMYRSVVASSTLGKVARFTAGAVGALFAGGAGAMLAFVPYPFGMWVIGLALIVVFSWLSFTIATKIFDIFIRIGFVVLLTPFLIATCAFPLTRQYTKRGWDFLVHALLTLMGLSIGIALTLAIFRTSFTDTSMQELARLMQVGTVYNNYATDLYEVFSEGGGAFYTLFIMLIVCMFGIKIINSTQTVVEALSGLTAGIPSVCGAAIMGMIKFALAPFKLGMEIGRNMAAKSGGDSKSKPSESDKDSGEKNNQNEGASASKLGKFGESVEKATDVAGKGLEKTSEAAGKAVEKGANAAGTAVDKAGSSAGKAMMTKGAALSSTGLGAIVGVPLMIAGAATTVGSKAAGMAIKAGGKAASQGIKQAGKMAGKAVKQGGKVAGKAVKAGGRSAAKGIDKGKQGLKNVKKGLTNVKNAVKNPIKTLKKIGNKMKQAPAKIKNAMKNRKENAQNRRQQRDNKKQAQAQRREQAMNKYAPSQKVMSVLDKVENMLDRAVEAGDSSFGENR